MFKAEIKTETANAEDEHALRKEMVKRALDALATEITEITHFE
jgi:betaine reductase